MFLLSRRSRSSNNFSSEEGRLPEWSRMSIRNPNNRIRRDGEAGERQMEVDRLSSLPDHILHHVLSFLPATNFAVQTSVLSRRWRSLWKHVPRLNLDSVSFTGSSFARYVDEVLSRRSGGCNVDVIRYCHTDFSLNEELFQRVVKFAASHGCREFVVVPCDDGLDSNLLAPLANSNLRVLRIRRAALESGFGSCGFRMLTTLELFDCWLPCDTAADLDPFANFPCLENLILSGCGLEGAECGFKINGPRLVKLRLHYLDCSELEICAPQLKFFDYLVNSKFPRLFNLRLPSLDHAKISVYEKYHDERNKDEMKACYISLLQGLHNVSSLNMDCGPFEVLCKKPELLEHQSCPFTRLKSLKVAVFRISYPFRLPSPVISYFLTGSSTREPASIEFG